MASHPWAEVLRPRTPNDALIVRQLVRLYEQRFGRVQSSLDAKIAWNRMLLTREGRNLVNDVLDWWNEDR